MKFNLLVCMTACVMLFAECKKENSVKNGILSINNSSESQEVTFEDVATNVRIVPLISDEPMDGGNSIKCYGSTAFLLASGGESIYIFEDGKMTAKLHKVGRGRGEYTIIADYAYSPATKTLFVQGTGSTILKYSVPDLDYLGSFSLQTVTGLAVHDDSTLICRMTSPDDIPGIYFINADNGQIRGKLKDICGLALLSGTRMDYYTPDHRILADGSSINRISEVSADINDGEKIILQFDFGKDGMPAKFDSISSDIDMDFLIEYGQYLNDHLETVVTEISKVMANDSCISFWYNSGLVGYNHYCCITDGQAVTYKGFKASGTNGFILPSGLTDQGQYVTIIDGLPESLFDDSGERSEFTANLEKVMKAQNFNNPVLVYYNIR